jgi:long-chain acyl-CoA synthetase
VAKGATSREGRNLNRLRFLLNRRITPATVLDWACESHPDSAILEAENPLPYPLFPGSAVSTREVLSFATRAGEVLAQAGMRRHSRVAIFKRNEIDYVFLSLAVIRAGGIAVPVNPGMPVESLGRYLQYTGTTIVCCDQSSFAERIGNPERLPMIDHWVFTDAAPSNVRAAAVLKEAVTEVTGDAQPVSLSGDSHVVLAHTSGTTGTPKAVICTAGSFVEGIRTHYRTEPLLPWKRVGLAGPFSHLVNQIGLTTLLLSNMPTWALDGSDARSTLDAIERERINLFVAFPDLYLRMYAHGLDAHDLSSVRIWISVADTSQEAHMRAFCAHGSLLRIFGRSLFGAAFVEPLGSSEIGGPALRRIWFAGSKVRCRRRIGRRMLGGPRVKVADDSGRPVEPGRTGRLMVKGPTLFAGYWNAHDRMHGTTVDGWWATGDIVYRDRARRFYHMDRESDVVHTEDGAFYTLPAEDVLHTYPGVYEAVVFGVPNGDTHQRPVGLIWADDSCQIDERDVLRWANERISGPVPLSAVWRAPYEDIPRGLTGKVLKRALRDHYSESAPASAMGVGNA